MTSQTRMRSAAGICALVAATLFTSACNPPTAHPNQISEFDGSAYDSLTLAHGALASLRSSVSQDFATYSPEFNDTVKAYNDSVGLYAIYRATQNEAGLASSLGNLTVAIVSFETTLQAQLQVIPAQNTRVRNSTRQIRARALQAHVTISDIITELEIAAAIAETVPAGKPYSALARAIVSATAAAVAAEQSASGKPIDLLTIPVLSLIS